MLKVQMAFPDSSLKHRQITRASTYTSVLISVGDRFTKFCGL